VGLGGVWPKVGTWAETGGVHGVLDAVGIDGAGAGTGEENGTGISLALVGGAGGVGLFPKEGG
jgi:hypothetical protein